MIQRRHFLRTGMAIGVAGLTSPSLLAASSTRLDRSAEARRFGAALELPLRLHHAENPRGLSPRARQAIIDAFPGSGQYGSTERAELVRVIAGRHGVDSSFLAIGNGSTDAIRQAVQALGGPGMHLVAADPTYEDVFRYSRPFNARVTRVPLRADFSHDIQAMRRATDEGNSPVLVYICQPNNPTGTVTEQREIDSWIEGADPERVHFVIDEASHPYVQHTGYWSADRWVEAKRNVVVTRTFSKIYGMAGLRLGYGLAHPETAQGMSSFWAGGVSHLTAAAALASMEDTDWVRESVRIRDEARRVVYHVFDELGIEYIPTQTNYLMHRIRGDLSTYQARMSEHDILVGRAFPPMTSYSRVGLGLPESMEYFGQVLRDFREREWI